MRGSIELLYITANRLLSFYHIMGPILLVFLFYDFPVLYLGGGCTISFQLLYEAARLLRVQSVNTPATVHMCFLLLAPARDTSYNRHLSGGRGRPPSTHSVYFSSTGSYAFSDKQNLIAVYLLSSSYAGWQPYSSGSHSLACGAGLATLPTVSTLSTT